MDNQYGFLALVMRQHMITRWSLMESDFRETDLEHVGSVSLLCLLSGMIARRNGVVVNLYSLMVYGNSHDQIEVIAVDLPSPIKNATPAMAKAYAELEEEAERRLIASAPLELQDAIYQSYHPQGIEKALGKACDSYNAYLKSKLEFEQGNKEEFQDAYFKMVDVKDDLRRKFPEIAELDDMFMEGGLYEKYLTTLSFVDNAKQFSLENGYKQMEHASLVCTLLHIIDSSPLETKHFNFEAMMVSALLNNEVGHSLDTFKQTLSVDDIKLLSLCNDYVVYMKSVKDIKRLPEGIKEGAVHALEQYVEYIIKVSPHLNQIHCWFSNGFGKSLDALCEMFSADLKSLNKLPEAS